MNWRLHVKTYHSYFSNSIIQISLTNSTIRRKKLLPFSESGNLDDVITRHIREVLVKTRGKIHGQDGAAKVLGINSSTLRNRMNKLGIKYGRKA